MYIAAMARTKLRKIEGVGELENVFVKPEEMKGKWAEWFGGGEIVLELACAAGGYTLALAEKWPQRNFVGVDKKGDRIWRGAQKALADGQKNVAFVRCMIEHLDGYFAEGEVREIWITFPDPFSKPSRAGRRLTSERFLPKYKKILRNGGKVHLKTDDLPLFEYSVETAKEFGCGILEEVRDVHGQEVVPEILQIETYYEKKWKAMGRKIYYFCFDF